MVSNFLVKYRTARRVIAIIALLLCVAIMLNTTVFAEGSRNLVSDYDSGTDSFVDNSGYRPHIEWYGNNYTANILRHQIIYVYAYSGETLLVGSSIYNSTVKSGGVACDIEYLLPDGTVERLDVIQHGVGHINTHEKELRGPEYTSGGNTYNSGGYTPLEITATQTGIYEFHFFSLSNNNANPALTTIASGTINTATGGTVSAWDITVIKDYSTSPVEVPGRMFTYYLAMNVGGNNALNATGVGIYSDVFVLTTDGYVYRTDFNGLDPYGYIFFANNRGLTNQDPYYNMSLYSSAVGTTSNVDNLQTMLVDSVQFHSPSEPDTDEDKTFKIFFDMPAEDLPSEISPEPMIPGSISNFRFVGDAYSHGYVGQGGRFYFEVSRASSFQIEMKFDLDDDGIYDSTKYLANSCQDGENSIFWDGTDGEGNIVPAGSYGSNGLNPNRISVKITLKAGEYHFPMLDVENNHYGIKIRLMNNPLDSDGNAVTLTEAQRCTVFYDNTPLTMTKQKDGVTVLEHHLNGSAFAGEPVNALDGFDTSGVGTPGASRYSRDNTYGSSNIIKTGGDQCAIDIWTYYKGVGTSATAELESFVLEDPDPSAATGLVRGFAFYDTENDGFYEMVEGDHALPNCTAELHCFITDSATGEVTDTVMGSENTLLTGYYMFPAQYFTGDVIEYDSVNHYTHTFGNYYVKLTCPIEVATCTTHPAYSTECYAQSSEFALNVTAYSSTDINFGFYYPLILKPIMIDKAWSVPLDEDPSRPGAITIVLEGRYEGTVEYSVTEIITASDGWKRTFADLPREVHAGEELTYTVKEYVIDDNGVDITDRYFVDYSALQNYATYDKYTITNTPKGLCLTKTDSASPTTPVANAVFELYRRETPEDVLVGTYHTNNLGRITVTGLGSGTYYFKETMSPGGYISNATSLVTADAVIDVTSASTSFAYLNITNDPVAGSFDFTVTKTLTQVSATDQSFVVKIACGSRVVYSIFTVPAGDLFVSKTFSGFPAGVYNVSETDANWRYESVPASCTASDGTNTYYMSSGVLTMTHNSAAEVYNYNLVNSFTKDEWIGASSRVTNIMGELT